MRNVSRALLAAATALPLSFAPAPAHATPGGTVAFVGNVRIGCFGCGSYGPLGNSADLTALGAALTGGLISGRVTSTRTAFDTTQGFTVDAPPGLCLLTGYAVGDTAGAVRVHFNWTRIGATALITTTGEIDGAAVATFTVVDPIVGLPCGGPIDAAISGLVVGV